MDNTRETTMEYVQGEKCAYYFTSIPSLVKRMNKLVEKYPESVEVQKVNKDGSTLYAIPARWMKQPRPPRTVSDKTKEAARKRMLELHHKGKGE